MMTADEILAAHAKRCPASYRNDIFVRPKPKPWWQCSPALGGDIRKIVNNKKEKHEQEDNPS